MKYLFVLVLILFSCKDNKSIALVESNTAENENFKGVEPTKPEETEVFKPVPPTVKVETKNGVPSDAIVLFDGSNLREWVHVKDSTAAKWILNEDGSMTVKNKSGDIQTKREFENVQLHIEWRSPAVIEGEGQSRANSGVFLQKRYEVQVLDNNNNDTYVNGQVGSIYKQHIPLVMASVASGEWNTYDIIYHAPVFSEEGIKIQSGRLTLLHNGVLVHDNVVIKGTTAYIGWPKNDAHGKAPIQLQDHQDNSRVSYRNIWVREL
ncbi:MAG: DUF1080 domain-containing protein [Cellulophaga sp.]